MERNAGTKDRAEGSYAYSPYGELEEGYAEEGTPFLYQDDYLDPQTLLYLMQARWYDPSTSTLLSQDPEMGEAQDPQLRLPYTYCAGDPVNNSDPSGKTAKDLALAMQKPVLARLIARNPSLMLAILMKPGKGKKTSFLGGLLGNRRRAEGKSDKSAWPLIEVQPRDFNQPFSMERALSGFSLVERVIVAGSAAFWRGNRLDPFFGLFGIDKNNPRPLIDEEGSGFYGDILAQGKEAFKARIAANFAKLPFRQKLLVTTCYNPLTQEFDVEKFQAVAEYYMFREIYEADYEYKQARTTALGMWNPVNWGRALVAMAARAKANITTAWTIDRTLGPVVLSELMHSAQLLNYAVVEPNRWEEAKLLQVTAQSPLMKDPVYQRFEHTIVKNIVDLSSDLSTFFNVTDVVPWQIFAR